MTPNGLALSRAAPLGRDDNPTGTGCQNAPDLVAASGAGWSALIMIEASPSAYRGGMLALGKTLTHE
jgi:hypothetical protein